jgi:hypothetical protein
VPGWSSPGMPSSRTSDGAITNWRLTSQRTGGCHRVRGAILGDLILSRGRAPICHRLTKRNTVVLHPQMELEGVVWLALLPAVLVAAAGLAIAAEGLLRRRGWARWAAVVAFSLLGVTALAGLADWIGVLVRSRAHGWNVGPAPIDLVTSVLLLAVSVGVVVLLVTPATRRDFRFSRQPPAGTNGR